MNDKEFASITGPAAEGTLFTFGPATRATRRPAKAIVESSRPRTSIPRLQQLYTYAAMQVWSQAVAKARFDDPKKGDGRDPRPANGTPYSARWVFDAKGDISVRSVCRLQMGRQGQLCRVQS